jgi:hypothetical protein
MCVLLKQERKPARYSIVPSPDNIRALPTRRARCLLPKPARSLSRQCGSPAARRAPCHATSQSMRDAYFELRR